MTLPTFNPSSYVTSLIRTIVPTIIGALIGWVSSISWLADLLGLSNLSADKQASLTATAVGVAIALYFSVVRKLEQKWPQLGWLLGKTGAPVYVPTSGVLAVIDPALAFSSPADDGLDDLAILPPPNLNPASVPPA